MADILATYEYSLINNNTEYEIICANKGACTKAIIPSEYNGLPVTSIRSKAFSYCSSLTSIEIPSSVTSIGSEAFGGCSLLTKVNYTGTIDSWVQIEFGFEANPLYHAKNLYINDELATDVVLTIATNINAYAFDNCSSLTSIEIPDSVTSIGNSAFRNCSNLESVTFGANSKLESIAPYAFSKCTSLTSIEIPSSVTSIGNSAFSNCSSLTSVTIPDSVTSIDYYVFSNCASLTNIIVDGNNKNYKSIDGNLYNKYGTILIQYAIGKTQTSFTIPNSVRNIGYGAFSKCTSLTSIEIPSSVTSIGNYAFEDCSSLTSVTIPDGVTSIGWCAFENCFSLESVVFGANSKLKSIGDWAFSKCSILTSIEIPNSVTSIGHRAFDNCSSLTSIEIPDSVTSIGNYAFYYCESLTIIVIGDNVTSIGSEAFRYCSSLTKATLLSKTPPSISNLCFSGAHKNLKFYCFNSSLEAYKTATNWKSYTNKFVGDDLAIYFTLNANAQKGYFASKEDLSNITAVCNKTLSPIYDLYARCISNFISPIYISNSTDYKLYNNGNLFISAFSDDGLFLIESSEINLSIENVVWMFGNFYNKQTETGSSSYYFDVVYRDAEGIKTQTFSTLNSTALSDVIKIIPSNTSKGTYVKTNYRTGTS